MSKQEPTCDACGHLVSEHDDKGCTVELDSAWTASGCKPCGCSRRRNDPRNVRKLSQSERDEIMSNSADVYVNAASPTPMPSEGPTYRLKDSSNPHHYDLVGPEGTIACELGYAEAHLSVGIANDVHSRATAKATDKVEELVRAAKDAAIACDRCGLVVHADALRSALSNPAFASLLHAS